MTVIEKEKQRIEFIDLAKGVCVLLVVLNHIHGISPSVFLSLLRMPLYFILSGIFFKTYGGALALIIKKSNKLLIPMLVFHLLGHLLYLVLLYMYPSSLNVKGRGFFDFVFSVTGFNGPVWFLLALFWCNLLFYLICVVCKNVYTRIVLSILCGAFGCYLGENNIVLPAYSATAFTVMPFFAFGYVLKKTSILVPNTFDKYNWILGLLLLGFASYAAILQPVDQLYYLNQHNGGVLAYCGSMAMVTAFFLLCKKIKRIPVISYMGRYSIVVLVLHTLLRRPVHFVLRKIGGNEEIGWLLAEYVIVVILCLFMIPLCKRFIPWFIAQKDIIPYPLFSSKVEVRSLPK